MYLNNSSLIEISVDLSFLENRSLFGIDTKWKYKSVDDDNPTII